MSFIPKFEHGLILKKHMLDAIRDYPIEFINRMFWDYYDGIISGLNITIIDNRFNIGEGIIKKDGHIFFVDKMENILFNEEKNYVYLDVVEDCQVDGNKYSVEIIHTNKEMPGMFELFRYIKNANMKKYEDIEELFAEVINRIDQRNTCYSISGGNSLSNGYFVLFAKNILRRKRAEARDIAFAYQCLNGIANIEIVKSYFGEDCTDNISIIAAMKKKIDMLGNGNIEEMIENNKDENLSRQTTIYC